jgi:hypothetical protein
VQKKENCLILDALGKRYGKLPSEILDIYNELSPLMRFYLDIHIMTQAQIYENQLQNQEMKKWQKNL